MYVLVPLSGSQQQPHRPVQLLPSFQMCWLPVPLVHAPDVTPDVLVPSVVSQQQPTAAGGHDATHVPAPAVHVFEFEHPVCEVYALV